MQLVVTHNLKLINKNRKLVVRLINKNGKLVVTNLWRVQW